MPLTSRQKEDLKSAVAAFLKEIGAHEAREAFIRESDVHNVCLSRILLMRKYDSCVKDYKMIF